MIVIVNLAHRRTAPISTFAKDSNGSVALILPLNSSAQSLANGNHSLAPNARVQATQNDSAKSNSGDVIGWLTMGPASNFRAIKERFQAMGPKARLYFHSYDEPCPQPDDGLCVFEKGTSFARGRNLLLQTALHNKNIKYFVFFDDDIKLLCGESLKQAAVQQAALSKTTNIKLPTHFPPNTEKSCWESFTDMLLDPNTDYPFIKPLLTSVDLGDSFTIRYQSCCDENFKGFHRDYLWFFFPSSTHNEHISWWFNGRSKMYLAQRCFKYAWKVDGNWGAKNDIHRRYPQDERVDRVEDLLSFTYPELGPWNISKYICRHRCDVSPTQPVDINDIEPLCTTALQARYHQWRNGTFEL